MTKPSDAAKAAPEAAGKKVRGKPFVKGRSGNPVGMRPGTRHRMTVLAEQLMTGDVEAVVAKVIRKAKAGDMVAAKMVLDRVVPVRKGRPAKFSLPPIKTAADVVAALATVTAAMSAGQLSPPEAVEIAAVIELARKAIEMQDVEARLHALEERFK